MGISIKNVLVTGGAGFIGSNFIHYLLTVDTQVRILNLDVLTYAGNMANLVGLPDPARHLFVKGDIADTELVSHIFHQHAIDTVVNFAAETHVDRSILGPMSFVKTNVLGTARLLEVARQAWIDDRVVPLEQARFHHISTDEVFGSLEEGAPAFSETTPYNPRSPYAASKAASDHLVMAYAHTYGLPVTITNCSNNYGPRQFPEKLIPLIILNALEGRDLPLYGDGQHVRDWLYVEDHCRAIHSVLLDGRPGEVYIVGGGTQPTNLDVVRQVCAILDEKVPASAHAPHTSLIRFVADRPGHDRRYAMDSRKIAQEIGWSPRESLTSGLAKTVEWYLANRDWVHDVRESPSYQAWLVDNYAGRGGST
jgi:dTDP-glucose 4,6-dehydratase